MQKKVLITGITGQDGSYMAEYCINLGHLVIGMVRRTSQINDKNYQHLLKNPNFKVVYGDLLDSSSIDSIVQENKPDYFINFAAQSFVGVSWKIPEETFMAGAVGVLKCLEAVRKYAPLCRFYNAGSSEEFGNVEYIPQDEKHPVKPRSPYGAAKAAARLLTKVYRESYGLYAVQGYLFNHESERRGEEFVTRKITKGVARIKYALENHIPFDPIELGNIDAKRDWSHAKDFVDGVWRMLNQENINIPWDWYEDKQEQTKHYSKMIKEYVLSSNETHTIREFIEKAFQCVNFKNLVWQGEGINEIYGWNKGSCLIKINPEFYRPAEVDLLLGDSSLARKELGWEPKISFDKLVSMMVKNDLQELGIK
jgi:GDPmannose 4,6-dehydratase